MTIFYKTEINPKTKERGILYIFSRTRGSDTDCLNGAPTPCSPTTDIWGCPCSNYTLEEFQLPLLVPDLMKEEEELPFPKPNGCERCHNFQSLESLKPITEILTF